MAEELNENNLYINGVIVEFLNGEQLLIRDKLVYTAQEGDDWHTVKKDDELGRLAWRYYGKYVMDPSKYWWIIADVNNIINPFDLSEYLGKDILIPNIYTIKLMLSTPNT